MKNLTEHICNSVEETYNNRTNLWGDSPFEKLTLLTNDERGKWGEKTVKYLIETYTDYIVEWDEDKNINQNNGIYDLIVESNQSKNRIEIKTATRGNSKNPNWQHENLIKEKKWDKLTFLDIDFFGFYLTIIGYDEINFDEKHPVFGRTPTLRKSQNDKYKFDFGMNQQRNGIKYGMTYFYDITNPNIEGLIKFLTNRFL